MITLQGGHKEAPQGYYTYEGILMIYNTCTWYVIYNTHGGEPTSHHVILMIGYMCYFWKSCAIRVRLCLIFPLILVRFA